MKRRDIAMGLNLAFSFGKRPVIGVDVGAASIKVAQPVGPSRDGDGRVPGGLRTVVLPRAVPDQPLSETEVGRLWRVLDRQGFVGKRVVLATPDSKVITETLKLPPAGSGAPRRQLARGELARIRGLDPSAFEFDFWDVPMPARGGEAGHVTACACRHADSDPWLDRFESQGFEVAGLDVKPCVLARACHQLSEHHGGMLGLIDLGWQAVRLVLVHQSAVIFARSNLDAGLGRLHAALAKRFKLEPGDVEHLIAQYGLSRSSGGESTKPPARLANAQSQITQHVDRAVNELARSITYARHRYPETAFTSLRLIGGGALIPGLPDQMANALGMEVSPVDGASLGLNLGPGNPAAEVASPPTQAMTKTASNPATLATAIGLAQWSPTGGERASIAA